MKKILVKPNSFALVDNELFGYLNKAKWYMSNGYAISGSAKGVFKSRTKMHRIVLGAKADDLVDHIDGNKLNNQLANLRIATREQNVHNQKKRNGTKNNYKGVNYVKRINAWQSRCRMNGQDFFLGYYSSEIAAAYAYNKKAAQLSEFALVNHLPQATKYLEQILIKHRLKSKVAKRVSKYSFVYYREPSAGSNAKKVWNIVIHSGKNRIYKTGFTTDEQAHQYIVRHYLNHVKDKPLLRRMKAA